MMETVEISIPDELEKMNDEKLFKFLKEQSDALEARASEICKQQGLGKYRLGSVRESIAKNHGFELFDSMWVKPFPAMILPARFKNVIRKYAKRQTAEQTAK